MSELVTKLTRRVAKLEKMSGKLSDAEFIKLSELIANGIGSVLKERLAGLMRYRGVFQRAQKYAAGDAVTESGALCMCVRATRAGEEKPGQSDAWRLAVKSK